MSATVLSVRETTSKFNNSPAIRLDFLTEAGIKSKTINIDSSDYRYLTRKYGDISSLKGQKLNIELVANPYKNGWQNVVFK